MNCPVCTDEMVKARATNFGPDYDYCRTCKKELAEMGVYTVPVASALIDLGLIGLALKDPRTLSAPKAQIGGTPVGPLPVRPKSALLGILFNCSAFVSVAGQPDTHAFASSKPAPQELCNCGQGYWSP